MTRLSQCVLSIMELPRHLVPQPGLIEYPAKANPAFQMKCRRACRQFILELGDRFEAAKGWGLERVFNRWAHTLPWRVALPDPFELPA